MDKSYLYAKIKSLLFKKYSMLDFCRKKGMKVGENPRIFCDIYTPECYLIEIGDNVTISTSVQLITHDASIAKAMEGVTDIFGKIKIGNNCFIGARSIILPGCSLADNTIVAAGSVVTKSVKECGKVIGGNPAKVICNIEEFAEKNKNFALDTKGMSWEEKRDFLLKNNDSMLVR